MLRQVMRPQEVMRFLGLELRGSDQDSRCCLAVREAPRPRLGQTLPIRFGQRTEKSG